jgi:predicted DNA-binding transcriptional regulator AlpA
MRAGHSPYPERFVEEREPLLSARDVAEFLGVPIRTLYVWRTRGGGPPAFRVGPHLRYRRGELLEWLEERKDGATPETREAGGRAIREV